jgi:hypothetical protein
VFTSAYRPTTNGQVERWNAKLVDAIAMLAFERDLDLGVGLARCLQRDGTLDNWIRPIDLSSTRDPCPNVWNRQASLVSQSQKIKYQFRHQLLERAAKFRETAAEKTEHKLERYKELHDKHVRK